MARWRGSYYLRKRGKNAPNWRNRNNGVVVKSPPKLVLRTGKRNKAVILPKNRYLGAEHTGQHFFNSDPRNSTIGFKKYKTSVRPNRLNAKKRRSAHTRKLR